MPDWSSIGVTEAFKSLMFEKKNLLLLDKAIDEAPLSSSLLKSLITKRYRLYVTKGGVRQVSLELTKKK
jgi:hypothetical protein